MTSDLKERFEVLSPLVDDAVSEFMRRIVSMSKNIPEHSLCSAYGVSQIMQASNLFALNGNMKDSITPDQADFIITLLNRKASNALGTLIDALGAKAAGVPVQ